MPQPTEIPLHGQDPSTLLAQMARFADDDARWREGRTWSLVYHVDDAHAELLKQAYQLFASTNGLNPFAFKSLKRMEAEVVAMTAQMLKGDGAVVGTMTSGGTESILLAVKAARDRARRRRPWLRRPEMVVPATIHAAFDKAAHYFGVKIRRVAVTRDYRADVAAMRRAIGRRTVLVAASAPQYPHGVIDPIEELGELAAARGIPFHVDACIGGFMLPWLERLGRALPPWDFRVRGVTSISADAHKYGYAAKGASVILYRDMEHLKHQFFVETDWCGGIYASPTIPGTRPGGSIAAAWAAMRTLGQDGYQRLAAQALQCSDTLIRGIGAIEGLAVVGKPQSTLVAFESCEKGIDIFSVADRLEKRGWLVDRQQHPSSIHCTVTAHHRSIVDRYLADLAECVAFARAHPELRASGNAAMYGMMAKIPARGLVRQSVGKVMERMYRPGGGVPDLTELGSEESDGFVLRAMHRWGERLAGLLK